MPGGRHEYGSLRDCANALKILVEIGLKMLRYRGSQLKKVEDLLLFYAMGRDRTAQLDARRRVAAYIKGARRKRGGG